MQITWVAQASFNGNAGGPVVNAARGCTIARLGVGDYTVTLGYPVDARDIVYSIGGTQFWTIEDLSDTLKDLTVYDTTGAATDDFTISVAVGIVRGGGAGS